MKQAVKGDDATGVGHSEGEVQKTQPGHGYNSGALGSEEADERYSRWTQISSLALP